MHTNILSLSIMIHDYIIRKCPSNENKHLLNSEGAHILNITVIQRLLLREWKVISYASARSPRILQGNS